jgi:hypothetical protein
VTVLHLLHPEELAPRLIGQVEMLDAESGAHANYDVTAQSLAAYAAHLQGWLDVVELACIESKVFYTRLSTGWALDAEMLPHLRRLGVLEAI